MAHIRLSSDFSGFGAIPHVWQSNFETNSSSLRFSAIFHYFLKEKFAKIEKKYQRKIDKKLTHIDRIVLIQQNRPILTKSTHIDKIN